MIKDIRRGRGRSSHIQDLTAVGISLHFSANDRTTAASCGGPALRSVEDGRVSTPRRPVGSARGRRAEILAKGGRREVDLADHLEGQQITPDRARGDASGLA
jgi:hypothetical protein